MDSWTRCEVVYWAARLIASETHSASAASAHLAEIKSLVPTFDTRIVDALILETRGDVDGALRVLREIDSPDARATLFSRLVTEKGRSQAIEWLNSQPRKGDPTFLTPLGWVNVAIALAEDGRWQEAAALLVGVSSQATEWPDLTYVRGVVHVALMLPAEFRHLALEMNVAHPWIRPGQGATYEAHREQARTSFTRAEALLKGINADERARGATLWLVWLRLSDPDATTRDTARRDVQQHMLDELEALDFLNLVRAFNIDFDSGPLKKYLAERRFLGGLEPNDVRAEMILANIEMEPARFADYLDENYGTLAKVTSDSVVLGLRIEALMRAQQWDRAEALLDANIELFEEKDRGRFRTFIQQGKGAVSRTSFVGIYQASGSLLDLKNLVDHLADKEDWRALAPYLFELIRRERTRSNVRLLFVCLTRMKPPDHQGIVSFVEVNSDTLDWDPEFRSAYAWALFSLGQMAESRKQNDILLQQRRDSSDIQLDINLAVVTGEWEHFGGVLDRETSRLDELDAKALLQLALLAAEVEQDSHRAYELAHLAVEKAPDDPHILVGAYGLAVQLGREGEKETQWVTRAHARSSPSDGPVWSMKFRKLAQEWIPAQRERAAHIEKLIVKGEIPLHLASSALNVPLSRLFLTLARNNADQADGRERVLIPIHSGARLPIPILPDWRVGLDITTILCLAYLDLLPQALVALNRIVLAPDTMAFLLEERRQARYHQPSVVKDAEELRALIDGDHIAVTAIETSPLAWLQEEAGLDLAELLETAKLKGGLVVRTRPIHKPKSFLEEEAALREYEALVVSPLDLVGALRRRGLMTEAEATRAMSQLRPWDRSDVNEADGSILDRPLYVDHVALNYLHKAAVLEPLKRARLALSAHPDTKRHLSDLIDASRQGHELAQLLNDVRITLRNAIRQGRVEFARQSRTELSNREVQLVVQLADNASAYDALCVDDRHLNATRNILAGPGRDVPIVSLLDLLTFLQSNGALSADERLDALHRLRAGGFTLLPLGFDELESIVRSAAFDRDGAMRESIPMKVLRQTLARLQTVSMVRVPAESAFAEQLVRASMVVIRRLWKDRSLQTDQASQFSTWILESVYSPALDMITDEASQEQRVSTMEASARNIALLLFSGTDASEASQEAFRNWADAAILRPLGHAHPEFLDRVKLYVKKQILEFAHEFAREHGGENRAPHAETTPGHASGPSEE